MRSSLPILFLIAAPVVSVANEPSPATDPVASKAWTKHGRDLQNTNHYPHVTGSKYEKVWSQRAGCPAPGMSSIMVDDHAMYCTSPCSNTGDTHAVSLDGKPLWANGVGQGKRGIMSSPCIHDGTVFSVDNGFIKAVAANDGMLKWQEKVVCGSVSLSSPVVYEGKLYLNGGDGVQILPIDRSKKSEDKLLPIDGGNGASTPAFHKGNMILQSLQRVYSYNTADLKQHWKVELPMQPKERLVHSPIIDVSTDRIFVLSSADQDSGRLHGLDFGDGSAIWQQKTDPVFITPSVTFDGHRLYVASATGTVAAYEAKDGTLAWKWSLPGESAAKSGKIDFSRVLRGIISTKNKLVFCTGSTLYILPNDQPVTPDFEIDLGGYSTPTPAFHNRDLFIRYRTKDLGACNYRYTEVKDEPAAELEVKIISGKAQIRNLTSSKLSFFQLCFGINVNEKQNCVLHEFELLPGASTELDLEQFMTLDKDVHHLLLGLEYEKPEGTGEFHHYFTIHNGAPHDP